MLEQAVMRARRALGLEPRRARWAAWEMALVSATVALAAGMLAMYFLDPRLGRGRRTQAADRMAATARRTARSAEQGGRRLSARAYGVAQQVRHRGGSATPADAVKLKHRVESEVFRDPDVPKGDILINAEEGTIILRGTARSPEQIGGIEDRVRAVEGVDDVRNLLHLPGMPAPEWTETVLSARSPVLTGDRG
jgi:osmotically-inducible protein OsmY